MVGYGQAGNVQTFYPSERGNGSKCTPAQVKDKALQGFRKGDA